MRSARTNVSRIARREVFLLIFMLFFGIVILPVLAFEFGELILGNYVGSGYWDFFSTLSARLRTGDVWAWFMVLSPYLLWQILRLTIVGWRKLSAGTKRQPSA